MKQFPRFSLFILVLVVFALTACGGQMTAAPSSPAADITAADSFSQVNCATEGQTVEIATAKLYVEYNATDADLGVHGAFDDHGWSELCVYAPNGDQILSVRPLSQLGDLTLAGIFFESREPEVSEFSFADLNARFPEGEYAVRGLSYDGTTLIGTAAFSHDIPAAPIITSPALAEDEESAADALVSAVGLVVGWDGVTETVNGAPVTITGYEVIITKVEHDDPHGYSRPVYDVHLPSDRRRLSVAAEFLEPGTVYELELLALEESGNQTITVGFFQTN